MRERNIVRQRDLAWSTYDAMLTKAQELNILRNSSNSEIRMGSRALIPAFPDPQSSPLLPTAAAAFAGFFFAVVIALVSNAVGGTPWFDRTRTRTTRLQRA